MLDIIALAGEDMEEGKEKREEGTTREVEEKDKCCIFILSKPKADQKTGSFHIFLLQNAPDCPWKNSEAPALQ